jgi:hypothetical protein
MENQDGKNQTISHKDKQPNEMDRREMLLKIIELTGARERSDEELSRILAAIEKIQSKPKSL